MKKVIYFILILALTSCMFFPVVVSADVKEKTSIAISEQTLKDALYDFVENNPSRTIGTDGEKQAAAYIAQKFFDYKLQSYFGEEIDFSADKDSQIDKYYNNINGKDYKGNTIKSNNVVGYIPAKNGSNDTVVIGAHFDNVYSFVLNGEEIQSKGAYDNGTGVAILLSIAQALQGQNFDFNVVIVAFTSEETGLYGSEEFLISMMAKRKAHFDNMLIMYNLDVVGAGDNLYLYTDEVKTGHGQYIQDVANDLGVNFKQPPKDKKIMLFSSYFYNLPYTHAGLMSDHANFYNQGKNVAFFFSMNWEVFGKNGIAESEKYDAIMHTRNDNLETLENNYGTTYPKFMADTANVIVACLMRDADFAEAMNASYANKINYNFWTNHLWAALIAIGVLAIFAAFIIFLYYSSKKKATPIVINHNNTHGGNADVRVVDSDADYIFGKDLDGKSNDSHDDPFGL